MNILGCLDRPTARLVPPRRHAVAELDDDALARLRSRTIGFVFQSYNLLPRTRRSTTSRRRCSTRACGRTERRRRARAALERLGLGDRVDHEPTELSRRPAAARRDRPRARDRAGAAPRRRADRQPRQPRRRRGHRAPPRAPSRPAGRSCSSPTMPTSPRPPTARSTSSTGGSRHERARAAAAGAVSRLRTSRLRAALTMLGVDHRRGVGRRPRRRRPGHDVEHHRPPRRASARTC